jgi:hypothetical protein
MGEGDYPRFSNKAKVTVSSKAKSWLTIREEADRSQPNTERRNGK